MSDPRLVARMFDAVARQVHTSAASLDLAPGQWAILRHLNQHNHYGRTSEQVATYFSEPYTTMKYTLASLERKRLVVSDTAADTLNPRYALTAAGEEKLDGDPIEHATRAIARMSAEDQADFCRLLESMLAELTRLD